MEDPENELLKRMAAHRSVREFTEEPVSERDVRRAVEAAEMASTSSWIQAYSLIQITDREERHALRQLCGDQPQVEQAGAFFCVCGDSHRHQQIAEDAGANYEPNLETFLLAVVDASLFAQNLALAFESLGYGICFIGGLRNRLPEVDAKLELPNGVLPLFGLCVGSPAASEEARAPRPRLPVEAVWTKNRYWDPAELREHLHAMDVDAGRHYAARGLAGRNWTGGIWRKFKKASREHLLAFYESKGARLR